MRAVTNRYVWNSGEPCDEDNYCGGECIDGTCYQSCENNNQCMFNDQCGKEICVPKKCSTDIECGPDNKCTSDKCIIGCQSDGQCPGDKNCIDDFCSTPPGNHLCDLLLNLA